MDEEPEVRVATDLEVVVLVRHGETVGESSIRFHGANDVALSDDGREQARAAASIISHLTFDRVVASSLGRAAESARIIAPLCEIFLDDALREINFGRWEGLTAEEIAERDPDLHARWREEGLRFDFPDGERRVDFTERVDRGLTAAFARDGATLLLVAHKGVVRRGIELLTHETLEQPHPELGEVFILRRSSQGFRIARS